MKILTHFMILLLSKISNKGWEWCQNYSFQSIAHTCYLIWVIINLLCIWFCKEIMQAILSFHCIHLSQGFLTIFINSCGSIKLNMGNFEIVFLYSPFIYYLFLYFWPIIKVNNFCAAHFFSISLEWEQIYDVNKPLLDNSMAHSFIKQRRTIKKNITR